MLGIRHAHGSLAAIVLAVAVAVGCSSQPGPPRTGSATTGEGATLVRPAVEDLTDADRRTLVDAFHELKSMPSPYEGYERFSYYDTFVKLHKDAFKCATQTAHVGPNFLPWHRQFLLEFERALGEAAGKPVAIPYWDWTNPDATEAVFRDDFMGGDGDPEARYAVRSGAFQQGQWKLEVVDQTYDLGPEPLRQNRHHLVRRMASIRGVRQLPRAAEVQRALGVETYDTVPFDDRANPPQSFRNTLEGWRKNIGQRCEDGIFVPLTRQADAPSALHNRVHYWVGGQAGKLPGTMQLNTSPNDPVFWLHHANVDRTWQSWMEIHGEQYRPQCCWPRPDENGDQRMRPYDTFGIDVTPNDMLDIDALGFSYSELYEPARSPDTSSVTGVPGGTLPVELLGICTLPPGAS